MSMRRYSRTFKKVQIFRVPNIVGILLTFTKLYLVNHVQLTILAKKYCAGMQSNFVIVNINQCYQSHTEVNSYIIVESMHLLSQENTNGKCIDGVSMAAIEAEDIGRPCEGKRLSLLIQDVWMFRTDTLI